MILSLLLVSFGLAFANPAFAARDSGVTKEKIEHLLQKDAPASKPLVLLIMLAVLSLIPFAAMMMTSFVKIAVTLSIVRSALGTQQIPPTQVITGLSIILSIYIMVPVGQQMMRVTDKLVQREMEGALMSAENIELLFEAMQLAKEPMRNFLVKHSHPKDIAMFYKAARMMAAKEDRDNIQKNDFMIITPAFVISELSEAFKIGFIIYIPFLVIDMVVANILMALGMQMLMPTTVSLPFKILLFVLVDGWYLLTRGLILGYTI